jgi:bacterioferritin-associated ferredoxin
VVVGHCRAVSDREIRWSILGGAASLDDVTDACGAGDDCGGCHPVITELLREAHVSGPALAARRSA